MAKDSQIDSKQTRREKSNGQSTFAQSGSDGGTRNPKKQSGSREKPGNDR